MGSLLDIYGDILGKSTDLLTIIKSHKKKGSN